MGIDIKQDISEMSEELVATRRDLHQHPELAFEEVRTADIVGKHLENLGMDVTRGIAETGVVGLLQGANQGPTLMIRADMDALPVQEPDDRPYSSAIDGKMHACGHDGHTAVAMAVASILAKYRDSLNGQVKFVFQPAEEIIAGGKAMMDAGVMQDPKVDKVLVFHMWSPLPVGTVAVQPGPIFSSVDEISITINGKGGHGGLPHLSVDPIPIACQLIGALQTLISRETPASQPVVLGFGSINGGSQFNIIPETVEMRGNLRTLDDTIRRHLLTRIEEMSDSTARAMGASCTVQRVRGAPVMMNDAAMSDVIADVARGVVGNDKVITTPPSPVGDDASYFLREAPGCYFLVGCSNDKRGIGAPHHSPQFDIDEDSLAVATNVMTGAALKLLA